MATVTSLGFSIFSRYDGSGTTRANIAINRLQRNLNNGSRGLNTFTGRMGAMVTAAVTVGPALLPIANVVGGLGAAFLATSAAAVVAGGLWAAMAKFQVQNINKLAAAHKHLDVTQQQYMKAQNGVTASFKRFAAATAKDTIRPMIPVMHGASSALGRLAPLFHLVSKEVQVLGNAIGRWLGGAGFGRFVGAITKFGVPALRLFIRAGRDLAAVLGFGWRALLPLGLSVIKVLAKGAAALRQWAADGGFQRWLASVRKDGPGVREFFTQLWGAVQRVWAVLKTASGSALRFATNMLKLVNSLDVGQIRAIGSALLLWKSPLFWLLLNVPGLTTVISKLLGALNPATIYAIAAALGIMKLAIFAVNVGLLSTPVGWIIIGLAAIGVGIVFLATKTRFFQTVWNKVWGFVKQVASSVWGFLHGKWGWLIALIGPVGWLIAIATHWRQVWGGIKVVASAIWGFLVRAWRGTVGAISRAGSATWGFMRRVFSAVWNGIKRIGSSIWGAMRRIFSAVWNSIRRIGSGIWGAQRRLFSTIWNGIRRIGSIVWTGMRRTFSAVWNTIRRVGSTIWSAMSRRAATVFRGMARVLSSIWRGIGRAARSAWNLLRKIVGTPVKFVINTVIGKLAKTFNTIAGKVGLGLRIPVPHVNFAQGGKVIGPGGPRDDRVPAMLSHGEYVIKSSSVKRIGVENLNAMNEGRRTKRRAFEDGGPVRKYALGGLVGFDIPNPFDAVKSILGFGGGLAKKFMSQFGSWTKPLIKKVAFGATDGLMNLIPGAGMPKNIGKAMIRKIMNAAINLLFDASNSSGGGGNYGAGLQWAKTQQGKRYQWGGNGNPSWDCSGFMSAIESVIRGQKPHRRWATGSFPPGAPGWKQNYKSPFQIGITNAGVGHTAGTLLGTNVECRGGRGCIVGPGARGANAGMFTSKWGLTVASTGGGGGSAKAIAKSMLGQFGWGQGQWPALEALWQRESGWNVHARNPSSGAYGIPQALPASKMASAGADWRNSAATQIRWGLGYIKGRYGSPGAANAFQRSHNWYGQGGMVNSFDRGGYLPKGLSLAYNGTGRPEPVGHDLGSGVTFKDCTFVGSTKREWMDLFVKAHKEADRKKRI